MFPLFLLVFLSNVRAGNVSIFIISSVILQLVTFPASIPLVYLTWMDLNANYQTEVMPCSDIIGLCQRTVLHWCTCGCVGGCEGGGVGEGGVKV